MMVALFFLAIFMSHHVSFLMSGLALMTLLGAGCGPSASATPVSTPTPKPVQPIPESSPQISTIMPSNSLAFPGVLPAEEVNKKVRIKTTLGEIVVQIDSSQGPNAASNFVYLVKQGFYNGTIFHRVIPGFMIQGGDPRGTGTGGPGYEFENDPVHTSYDDGVIAMANAGRDTNGSQFFIMVANYPLPPDYSIFGKVVEGLDVAHQIADVSRDRSDRPLTEVKMTSVEVE
ncbi:MAG: peptidylprolyl isomerase [Patescibacteria group bacterium]